MESVNDKNTVKGKEAAGPNKIMIQGLIDRDAYSLFRALCHSHKLTVSKGLNWAVRSLLSRAGVFVKPDRGTPEQKVSEES
jgi:hypothetical protein